MISRFCLSPLIGTGRSTEDAYRPALSVHSGTRWSAVIPVDPRTGQPLCDWALCVVSGDDLTKVLADAKLQVLPDIAPDAALSAVTLADQEALVAICTAKGLDISPHVETGTFRQVIESLGKSLDPSFDMRAMVN
ncbi:MAG: hypothetical protein QG671_3498 [Actinomycetota bacterium]|nr:hypothetical protein [Actinomycetota bacterium]